MSNLKHIVLFSLVLSLFFCISSCKPSNKLLETVLVSETSVQVEAETQKKIVFRRKAENRRILVALGPSWSNQPAILKHLLAEYGAVSSGGIVQLLQYPDDFLVEGRVRLSVLTAAASDILVDTVITLGTPDGTVRELSRLHASRPELHILTLFPEDDALMVEAASELVIEQAVSSELLADEDGSALSNTDVSFLLFAVALSGESTDKISPLRCIELSVERARQLSRDKKAATGWAFLPRIDPDTGLKSRNHVLLKLPPLPHIDDVKKIGSEVVNE